MSTTAETAGAILTVDLDAVVANWRLLRERLGRAEAAAVVKADAYGLGAERVAPALAGAGCRVFFVAHIDEGIALRRWLPEVEVHVLNGLLAGTAGVFAEHRLVPVLNSLGEIDAWTAFMRGHGRPLAADIHVDTGMSRLGLPEDELARLADEPARVEAVAPRLVISHLACADEPGHPKNAEQLELFRRARRILKGGRASFANSSGIFLGPDYHFDVARPGAALYGVNPRPESPNPMTQVIRLQGKILQVRDVDRPRTVGYGATHRIARRGRIATVAVGYADGFLRSLSNAASASVGGTRVPLVGRVSMDLITLDVSGLDGGVAHPGTLVELIGPGATVDAVAAAAGTIGYEILTSLGRRYHRVYVGGTAT